MTLLSLSWTTAMKCTGAKLDVITNPNMYLMVGNHMQSGIATILHRHATANNPLLNEEYDPSKGNSCITYVHAENLYDTVMSEPLQAISGSLTTSKS